MTPNYFANGDAVGPGFDLVETKSDLLKNRLDALDQIVRGEKPMKGNPR